MKNIPPNILTYRAFPLETASDLPASTGPESKHWQTCIGRCRKTSLWRKRTTSWFDWTRRNTPDGWKPGGRRRGAQQWYLSPRGCAGRTCARRKIALPSSSELLTRRTCGTSRMIRRFSASWDGDRPKERTGAPNGNAKPTRSTKLCTTFATWKCTTGGMIRLLLRDIIELVGELRNTLGGYNKKENSLWLSQTLRPFSVGAPRVQISTLSKKRRQLCEGSNGIYDPTITTLRTLQHAPPSAASLLGQAVAELLRSRHDCIFTVNEALQGSFNKVRKRCYKEFTTYGDKVVSELRFASCAKQRVVEKRLPIWDRFRRTTSCDPMFGHMKTSHYPCRDHMLTPAAKSCSPRLTRKPHLRKLWKVDGKQRWRQVRCHPGADEPGTPAGTPWVTQTPSPIPVKAAPQAVQQHPPVAMLGVSSRQASSGLDAHSQVCRLPTLCGSIWVGHMCVM